MSGSSQWGGSAYDLTPAGPGGCRRGAWGDGIVASESEGRELEVIEKRQNEANLPVVLIFDILRLRTNKRGIEQEKRTQFPAGGKGGSNEWRQNSGQWSVVSESGGSGVASESGAFCLLELRVFSTFLNILRLICSGPGYPTQRAGTTSCPRSERFWLLELRASRTCLDKLRPQFFWPWIPRSARDIDGGPDDPPRSCSTFEDPAFVEVVATDDPASRQYHVHLIAYAPAPTSTNFLPPREPLASAMGRSGGSTTLKKRYKS